MRGFYCRSSFLLFPNGKVLSRHGPMTTLYANCPAGPELSVTKNAAAETEGLRAPLFIQFHISRGRTVDSKNQMSNGAGIILSAGFEEN